MQRNVTNWDATNHQEKCKAPTNFKNLSIPYYYYYYCRRLSPWNLTNGDGFRSEVLCFLLLRLSAVHSAVCGVVFFVWTLIPFFSSLVAMRGFLLYLFIYLTNWDATNELLVGKMASTNFFFNTRQFSIVFFSLLLSTKQTRGKMPATKHLKTQQLFIVFLSSNFSKQTKVFTYPTHGSTGAPPTRKHTSLGLKSFIHLVVWV